LSNAFFASLSWSCTFCPLSYWLFYRSNPNVESILTLVVSSRHVPQYFKYVAGFSLILLNWLFSSMFTTDNGLWLSSWLRMCFSYSHFEKKNDITSFVSVWWNLTVNHPGQPGCFLRSINITYSVGSKNILLIIICYL
jgi:hypothetical protein